MTKLEHTLLDNIINSLDRLFDHENTVADVHELLIATHAAVGDSEHAVKLKSAADKVQSVLRSSMSPDRKRDAALVETDDFRIYLADILYRDSAL